MGIVSSCGLRRGARAGVVAVVGCALVASARADAVVDWNAKAGTFIVEARISPGAGNRALSIVETSVYEAVNAITGRYPADPLQPPAQPTASVDAAVAAANRAALLRLLPAQQGAIDAAYVAALKALPDDAPRAAGVALGEQAAAAVLALRQSDGAATPESYRPRTTPGVWVPTVAAATPQWGQRTPWLMKNAAQFRPGPPPALTSALYARDYNEIKALGARSNSTRTAEQTAIAKFWEDTQPTIYHGVVRSVAGAPEREVTRNARLFAAVTQAVDDALIAVWDAKFQYHFWRPITAIRNGDMDGNDATERDAGWLPFIDTPMHPEYPCAHCIVASTTATVLAAEVGSGPVPVLTTTSLTAPAAPRSWRSLDDFVGEVAEARICDGVHYRNSTEVAVAMGRAVGALSVARFRIDGR